MAAFAVPYIGCVPPEVLDVPIVSALVAIERIDMADAGGAPASLRRWSR